MELDTILEEVSIYYDKPTLLEMYSLATAQPFSFWYINLAASKVEDVFRVEVRTPHDPKRYNP